MTKTIQTTLICPECGTRFPIMRRLGKQKEQFHRKWLYCYRCKKETNHIEGRDIDSLIAQMDLLGEREFNKQEKEIYHLVKKRR